MPQNRMPGSSICSRSPDDKCYKSGHPACCSTDYSCPPFMTMCDNTGAGVTGSNYCANSPDFGCWPSTGGRPPCCSEPGGGTINCPQADDLYVYQPCEPSDSQCWGNGDCQNNQFCEFPDGDCGDSSVGECKPIPSGQDCNGVQHNKVCGCNNQVYKNWCKANQQGRTSIQNEGNCNSEIAFE